MNRRTSVASIGLVVLYVTAGLVLSGCISGHSDVTYGPKGPAVGRETLKQIRVGQTSKAWLLGALGEPSRQTQTPDGTEVLAYEYSKKVDSDLSFCIFLNFDDKTDERAVHVFEVKDGVVTRYWTE